MMMKKMRFWSIFALVVGSQLGSGIFVLPATLAKFGAYSILGWICSSLGALSLAWIFGAFCTKYPLVGGPYHYVKHAFGSSTAFFVGWTYWVVSWVSTTAVVVAAIAILYPWVGDQSLGFHLKLELRLLFLVTLLNLRGVQFIGRMEHFLMLIKIIPLVLIPLVALYHFCVSNIQLDPILVEGGGWSAVQEATRLTLWGFIGVEAITASTDKIHNASRVLPRAIMLGTLTVACLYLLSHVALLGFMPGPQLSASPSPYVLVTQLLFGAQWSWAVSLIMIFVYFSALSAWILASGQIGYGLAKDGLFPAIFADVNHHGAPRFGVIISALGIAPLLIFTKRGGIAAQLRDIIDCSVVSFVFIYAVCAVAFLWLVYQGHLVRSFANIFFGVIALLFSVWTLCGTPWQTLAIASAFVVSGIPLYLLWYRPYQRRLQ